MEMGHVCVGMRVRCSRERGAVDFFCFLFKFYIVAPSSGSFQLPNILRP